MQVTQTKQDLKDFHVKQHQQNREGLVYYCQWKREGYKQMRIPGWNVKENPFNVKIYFPLFFLILFFSGFACRYLVD